MQGDQALGLKDLQALAHDGPAVAREPDQLTLGRQTFAHLKFAAQHRIAHTIGDLLRSLALLHGGESLV